MAQEQEPQNEDAYASLTAREKRFVDAYVGEAGGNATEAARIAGFSDTSRNSLHVQGARMLRNATIKAAVSDRVNQFAMSAEEILANIADIARNSSIAGMLDAETYGKPSIILTERDPATGQKRIREQAQKYLKKLSITEEGVSVEVYDRFAALVQLGKYHRIWVERSEITGQNGEPLFKAYMDIDPDQV